MIPIINDFHEEKIAVGQEQVELRIPSRNYLTTLAPAYPPGCEDEMAELNRAMDEPIGSLRLEDMARPESRVVVVVNDITRPTPSYRLLPPLLRRLTGAGVLEEHILILVATGTHRANTPEELVKMLGEEVCRKLRVVNHNCTDDTNLQHIGVTAGGVPVVINRQYLESDLRVLVSSIYPHQSAGFSGGRKSVMPGLSGLDALKVHHGPQVRPKNPSAGWLEGNPFHIGAREAARMAGVDFIFNVAQNQKKEVTRAVAGVMDEAWAEGVEACRSIYEVRVPSHADIVVVSPGGFPKDFNLYQAQKAMSTAEILVRQGGVIILMAQCPDGIGSQQFYEWMAEAGSPEEVVNRFNLEGFTIGSSKAFMFARGLTRARLIVVTKCIQAQTLEKMFASRADTFDRALAMAFETVGQDASVMLVHSASDLMPVVEEDQREQDDTVMQQ